MRRPWFAGVENEPAFKALLVRAAQVHDRPDEFDRLLARLRIADGPFVHSEPRPSDEPPDDELEETLNG